MPLSLSKNSTAIAIAARATVIADATDWSDCCSSVACNYFFWG